MDKEILARRNLYDRRGGEVNFIQVISRSVAQISEHKYAFGLTLLYAFLVSTVACFHEVWRDEVVPMTMVTQADSLSSLIAGMHNYGHPGLWITLLYIGYHIIPEFFMLKVVNLLISIVGVYVFLKSSPFSRLQKTLFVFGMFPFYLYPVINRSYGLGMLLMFLLCALYTRRFERCVLFAAILFFLANTHVHALIIAIAVFISLILEFICDTQSRAKWCVKPLETAVGALLILTGIVVSIFQIIPDQSSMIYHPKMMPQEIARAWILTFINPGLTFPEAFGVSSAAGSSLVVVMLYLLLIRKPYLLIMAVTSVVGYNLFFYLIYGSYHMRHQGTLFLIFISLLWLNEVIKPVDPAPRDLLKYPDLLSRRLYVHRNFLLTTVLILYVVSGISSVRRDITSEFSSTRKLSVLLQRDDLKDAIIVGEPAYYLESLVYYLSKPFYFPREDRFGFYAHVTHANRRNLDLLELLDISQRLKAQYHKPVAIVLGHSIAPQGPYVNVLGYHQAFHYTKDSLLKFVTNTQKIASFQDAISDENFAVYLLK